MNVVQKIKTRIYIQQIFTENRAGFEILWKNIYKFKPRPTRCVFVCLLNNVIKHILTLLFIKYFMNLHVLATCFGFIYIYIYIYIAVP
jgi:hypothetical protein